MGYIQELRRLVGTRPLILPAAGVLLFDHNGRLLLQHRTDNHLWGIPGGCMEPGETLEETGRREVWEETGLRPGALRLFGVFSGPDQFYVYPNGDQVYIVSVIYETGQWTGDLQADRAESRELQFFALDELPQEISPPNRPVLAELLGRSRS